MREFKRPGFIDFNFERLHVGFVGSDNKDFAVISIGANPFSEPENPRFAILVAGAQYPGTALALQKLADPAFFVDHPFGGILEADVPRKQISTKNISWWDKIENSDVSWHTAGSNDLKYEPKLIQSKLKAWYERMSKGSLVPHLTQEEVMKHIDLIDALARARAV